MPRNHVRGAFAKIKRRVDSVIKCLKSRMRLVRATPLRSSKIRVTREPSRERRPAWSEKWWHFQVVYPALCRSEARDAGGLSTSPACTVPGRPRQRVDLVAWIVRLHDMYVLSEGSLFLAVRLADSFVAGPHVRSRNMKLVGATALLLATKFEEEQSPAMDSLVTLSENSFKANELTAMEIRFLQQVDYRIHISTVHHHLDWFHRLSAGESSANDRERCLLLYLAELGLAIPECSLWTPSHHAMASVLLLNQLVQRESPRPLAVYVSYDIVDSIGALLRKALKASSPGDAVYDKHSTQERHLTAQKAAELATSVFADDEPAF